MSSLILKFLTEKIQVDINNSFAELDTKAHLF